MSLAMNGQYNHLLEGFVGGFGTPVTPTRCVMSMYDHYSPVLSWNDPSVLPLVCLCPGPGYDLPLDHDYAFSLTSLYFSPMIPVTDPHLPY